MKITVICVGKLKEKYWKDAVAEYEKRLGAYCKLELIEVADEKTPEKASRAELERIKKKEGQRIRRHIASDGWVIALAIEGASMDSPAFAREIQRLGIQGKSHLIFLIGGSLGLDEELLCQADQKLSFSKMTFPHQLMRVILLEQLYRGYRISTGAPYHK